ncbi:MAG: prepilin-type N-terminal cleavage/methylation domain-containing protein [Candidatus Omnitrophica bacterium]|nr:prepilin-type N-terminal cleavage/methylation domain-containing protein [Candidatus Omnitrophota bacterium]
MKIAKNGVTLVELLIAITLTTIVGGAIGMIFNAAMETWRFGDEMASIEAMIPALVNQISEGDYVSPGIVDALVVTEASAHSIGFVPLIMEYFEPDRFRNEEQTFPLSYPYLKGSPVPKGQIRAEDSDSFRNIRTAFLPGDAKDPPEEHDRVQILDELPDGAQLRVIYRPDHLKNPLTIMRIHWDDAKGEITRDYLGSSEVLGKNSFGVSFMDTRFQYFSNVNLEIQPLAGEEFLEDEQRQQITAAKVLISGKKGATKKTIMQFMNMRNLGWAASGIVLTEGTEVVIPNSRAIRSLAIVNITGVKEKSMLTFEIESSTGQPWLARLKFDLIEEQPALIDYVIEYPVGKNVLTRPVFSPVAKGFDLLTFDETGRYDYDDDPAMDDVVTFDDETVTFRVTEMGIGGAALYVRP